MKKAYFCTAEELEQRGKDNLPKQFQSGEHLIYSSPATLAFNSPGAEGFGVKRAGLAVPGSIMLIVAPGCCGRNTSMISSMKEYNNRFFYLCMDETDIVTGRHLKKIPKAVASICESLEKKPSVVMICITCVDALLGTDMERVCRKAEEKAGLPVRPCYMYALTREGRKPPMVHVRQSLYSLLEPGRKKGNVVNLLGYFSPLVDDCELYTLLQEAGVKTIHEISRCEDFEEYKKMSEANFNLVLHPEARFAAEDFHDRLKIPFIELRRLYQIDKIASQYRAFGAALGVEFDDEGYVSAIYYVDNNDHYNFEVNGGSNNYQRHRLIRQEIRYREDGPWKVLMGDSSIYPISCITVVDLKRDIWQKEFPEVEINESFIQ